MSELVTLTFGGRPPTLNRERAAHWRRHRSSTAAYRQETKLRFRRLVGAVRPPIEVRSWPTYRSRRSWPDVGAWFPATKAVVDGLVDLGVLPEDHAGIVVRQTFDAPQLAGVDQLVVQLIPWPPQHVNEALPRQG